MQPRKVEIGAPERPEDPRHPLGRLAHDGQPGNVEEPLNLAEVLFKDLGPRPDVGLERAFEQRDATRGNEVLNLVAPRPLASPVASADSTKSVIGPTAVRPAVIASSMRPAMPVPAGGAGCRSSGSFAYIRVRATVHPNRKMACGIISPHCT